MLAGVCFKDGKVNQIFRKDEKFCPKCGQSLVRVQIWLDESQRPTVKIESEE